MVLVGQLDSPYVRRCAVSMLHLGVPFERRDLSVFADAEEMRKINPLGRVPSLVLDDGEVLVDSAAILDHLDEVVGPDRALVPTRGPERRHALQIIALATGICDKAIAVAYEHMLRPAETVHQPWLDRNITQLATGIEALESLVPDTGWLSGSRMLQPDITVAVMLGYLRLRQPILGGVVPGARLTRLSRDAEALPAFKAALPTTAEIGGADAAAALSRLRGAA